MKRISIFACVMAFLGSCQTQTSQEKQSSDSLQVSSATVPPMGAMKLLDEVLACQDYNGLVAKYGEKNIEKLAKVETGEGTFEVTKLFPNTSEELEIYWKEGQQFNKIQDVLARLQLKDGKPVITATWASKAGLYLGMPLTEAVKSNGKTFTITGFGWDLGGSVVSWEGGKLADKNVNARFEDMSGNNGGLSSEQYAEISGEREFDVQHASIQKLNPVIKQLSVFEKPSFDKAQGNKLYKQVEEKQMPKH